VDSAAALDGETLNQVVDLNLRGLVLVRAAAQALPSVQPHGSARGPGASAARSAPQRRAASGQEGGVPQVQADHSLPPAIAALDQRWQQLDDAALRRLAGKPYLLFEAPLPLGARWPEPAADSGLRSVQEARARALDAGAVGWAGADGRAFQRLLALYGWHLARAAPLGAALVLGVAPALCEQLRELSLQGADGLADAPGAGPCLRWATNVPAWRELLESASGGEPEALRLATLRGLQRIAGAARGV
jgi:hypothetical protein